MKVENGSGTSFSSDSNTKSEPTFVTQSPPRKSYNPFESDDEDTNDFVKSYDTTFDVKTIEENADSLAFQLDNDDISWEEAILVHSPISTPTINVEELFSDKTVTECELPELMICYKENSYHPVKDIGIDEGVPVNDKLLVKTLDSQGSENIPSLQVLNDDINGDTGIGNIDGLKSKSESNIDDSIKGSEYDYSNKVDEFKHEFRSKESDLDHQQLTEIDEVNIVKLDRKWKEDSKEDVVPVDHVKESSEKLSVMNSTEAVTELSENPKEEATSPQSLELSVQQGSSDSDVANALSNNSKVESGNDSSSSTILGKEEEDKATTRYNTSDSKPPKPPSMSKHEDGALGMDKWANGETSFSAAMPTPASIIYMGTNAHFGSTSLRSESSSTRSFAFPVLQAEWNSSPVRMAKADRKHRRKHGGWVQSLICCRF